MIKMDKNHYFNEMELSKSFATKYDSWLFNYMLMLVL